MSFVTETPVRERAWSAGGAAVMVVLMGYGLISGLRVSPFVQVQRALALIDIAEPPPPPRPKPPPKVEHPMTRPAKGKPSPANLRNKATPIVAPPPPPVRITPPLIAAPKPNVGMAPETGASNHAGPGQGAGGEGNGYGGGGDGDGGDIAPEPIRDQLKMSWLPPEVRATVTSTMAVVHVLYRIEIDGRISSCKVTRSSGNRPLDMATCAAIQQHFKYRPARDPDGTPFAADMENTEGWQIDRDGYDAPSRSRP